VCDETDGKQARKTKNGSPLGMVFDHGVDCFAAGLSPIIFARILQIGDNFIAKIFFMTHYQAFYFVSLEHYYLGVLRLPPINGVQDGSIIVLFLSLYITYAGNNVFATPTGYDARWLQMAGVTDLTIGQALALFISAAVTLLQLSS
jgi:ethanolaminephosphotransferase